MTILTLPQALKAMIATIAALMVFVFGSQLSDFLIAQPHPSTAVRWLAVFIATGSVVPWVLIIVFSLAASDEYIRQMTLCGTAIGFVGNLLLHVAFNTMQDARLVSWSSHLLPIPAAMGSWVFGVIVAALYFRFRP